MDESWDARSRLLLGDEAMARLAAATVLVAGLGGVGGYAAEVLARSGVGGMIIIDSETVDVTNVNRQLIALRSTVGLSKTGLWRQRLLDINPELRLEVRDTFITPDNAAMMLDPAPDHVADCIDTVASKCALLAGCLERHIPVISSMGAGGRLDPSKVRYGHLAQTCEDGLAKAVRTAMRRRKIDAGRLKVVWSQEAPCRKALINLETTNKRSSFGTLATIPALFGIYIANSIIRHISGV